METAMFESRIENGRERKFLTRTITKYLKKKKAKIIQQEGAT